MEQNKYVLIKYFVLIQKLAKKSQGRPIKMVGHEGHTMQHSTIRQLYVDFVVDYVGFWSKF